MRLRGIPDAAVLGALDHRLRRIGVGLLNRNGRLAPGNALWLAFVDEAYGPLAVRATLDGFFSGNSPRSALERGVRAAAGMSLEAAFREFHLWCVLTGDRSLGLQFPFAPELSPPRFAGQADDLPAIDDLQEPPVGPWGAAQIILTPRETRGGMTVRVEGELPGRWEADLVLFHRGAGVARRISLDLSDDARGEVTVPLDPFLREAILLVRRLDGETDWGSDAPLRFSWSARPEPGFPCVLGPVEAARGDDREPAVAVSWSTESEHGLAGFNVLRTDPRTRRTVRVNPIRIPALGDLTTESWYQFVDASADGDTVYDYRVEAVTGEGLSSLSDAVRVRLADNR